MPRNASDDIQVPDVSRHDRQDRRLGGIEDPGAVDEVIPLSAPVGGMRLGNLPLGAHVPVPFEKVFRLGFLHMLQHKGEALLPALKERFGDLQHEPRRIAVVIVFAGEIALRQIAGILLRHIGMIEAFPFGKIRDERIDARPAGVFQHGGHGIFQRNAGDDAFLRQCAALQLFGVVHAQRKLVPVDTAQPLVGVIKPGLIRAGIPECNR